MGDHYYNDRGEPRHYRADGRPTTLREARKETLLPSSTTIASILAKPALDKWKLDQVAKAGFENRPIEGEEVDGYAKRLSNLAYRETKEAANFGTEFHKVAEDVFDGKPVPPEYEIYLKPILQWKDSKGIDFIEREHPFGCKEHGFGGCIDIVATNDKGTKMICDYKTRKSHPNYPMKPYGQEITQLASYAIGYWGLPAVEALEVHAVNIFVSSTEPGRVEIHGYKPKEVLEGWQLFKAMAEVWFKIKKYDPRNN